MLTYNLSYPVQHTNTDPLQHSPPITRNQYSVCFPHLACNILPSSERWCFQTRSCTSHGLLTKITIQSLVMTNCCWDVIFVIAQCIFCMPSNDAEGMTDEDGVEWLMVNDDERGLIYLCFVHTKNDSADFFFFWVFWRTVMMRAHAGYIIMQTLMFVRHPAKSTSHYRDTYG